MAAAKGVGSVFIWVNVRLRNKSSVCLQLSAKVDTGADALVISNKQCADLKLVCVGEGAYHDIGLTFKVYEGAEIEYMGRSAEIVVHGVVDLEKPLLGMSAICALQVSIDIVGQNLILLTPYLRTPNIPKCIYADIKVWNYYKKQAVDFFHANTSPAFKHYPQILVDTGATTLIMSEEDVMHLNLGQPSRIDTLKSGTTSRDFKSYSGAVIEFPGRPLTAIMIYAVKNLRQPVLGMLALTELKVNINMQTSSVE
ncbi:unnamed protein product [Didymodactylos carnosus]|uniref:Uncharacterized protein n=1 Tax=Didymodactylos carnosus TaxID=1234261 RepID=A0A8S2DWU1_9BILA|nr:unnamed protein product [Didymodactylos carnosus]CAF3791997.1 unnamed protein product [Didymodactylos carnosus]